MAFFEDLVFTEDGAAVEVTNIGGESYYVVDDAGFRRHIEARAVDRVVLGQFVEQIVANRDEAAEAMLRLMGQDDLFTKAIVDSSLQNLNVEQMLEHTLPVEARQWLGMLGFRVVINLHGDVIRVEVPAAAEGPEDGD